MNFPLLAVATSMLLSQGTASLAQQAELHTNALSSVGQAASNAVAERQLPCSRCCGTVMTPEFQEQINSMIQDGTWDRARQYNSVSSRGETQYVKTTFHILRYMDGSGGMDEDYCQLQIDALNGHMGGTDLQFCIDAILTHDMNDPEVNYPAGPTIGFVQNTMNVYCTPNLTGGPFPLCGYASYPPGNTIVCANYCMGPGATTFSHEVGHFFGLPHTFNGTEDGSNPECVDGSNCATAGDYICDTPAEDNGGWSNCTYTGGGVDVCNSEPYAPLTDNLMSYNWDSCVDRFTEEQKSLMVFNAEVNRPGLLTDEMCNPEDFNIIHVPEDYGSIQEAINYAQNGYVIQLAPGTYSELNITTSGLAITIRGDTNPDGTLGVFLNGLESNRVLMINNGEGPDTIFENLEFTNCAGLGNGGAASCIGSSPSFINCTFSSSRCTSAGGGLYCQDSSPTITDCIFRDNYSPSVGGAIYVVSFEDPPGIPIITNTTFCNNDPGHIEGDFDNAGGNLFLIECTFPGACCVGSECSVVAEITCDLLGGEYLGDTTSCENEPCPPSGACCTNGICREAIETVCAFWGGTWLGEDTGCLASDCPSTCLGDINYDGAVDVNDILGIIGEFGATCP